MRGVRLCAECPLRLSISSVQWKEVRVPKQTTTKGKAQPPPRKAASHASECGPPCSLDHERCIFREIFDNSFDLICLLDRHGTVLEANRTALRQRNLKATEVVGRPLWLTPWWDISVDAQSRLKTAVRDAAKGRVVRYEVDLLAPDGGVCTYDVTIKSIAGDSRGCRYLLWAARDISERKRVERALTKTREDLELRVQSRTNEFSAANEQLKREIEHRQQTEVALRNSEARSRAILDAAVDAIITISDRGIVTSFNPAAERMFGYTAKEAIGRNVKLLMPEPYYSEHDRYLDNYLRTGKAKIIGIGREVVGRHEDGHTFPIDLAVSEVRLGDQRMFAGVVRDITERKRLEREILEISDQEQLRIGQDLHDGLGQELTGVALLAKVLGADLAAEKSPRADSAKKIAQLVQQAISKTRDLARGLSPIGLDAQGLAPALQELARHTDETLGIRCAFVSSRSIVPDEPTANVHLYRIAQESVNNAIKHGKAKTITIRLGSDDGNGLLVVEDDGTGLRNHDGGVPRGMGLRIMAYRARMIGALLTVRPGPSGGTVVTCNFRLARRRKQGRKQERNETKKAPARRSKQSARSPGR